MVFKLLLVDPDITFAISIKRALDQTRDFDVTVFGTAEAALEYLRSASPAPDGVVLDFNLGEVGLTPIIQAVRAISPMMPIIVTPRNNEQHGQVKALPVQGSILKPYYARQLIPVVRRAIRPDEPVPDSQPVPSLKPAPLVTRMPTPRPAPPLQPQSPPPQPQSPLQPQPQPQAPHSPDFDAAIASLPNLITEPPVSPDDTFRRHLAAMLPEKPATPSGLRKALESVELTTQSLSPEATIGDVVSGKPLVDPASGPETAAATTPAPAEGNPGAAPSAQQAEPAEPLADAALQALDSFPARGFTLEKFADTIEQTSGMPVPDWVRDSAEQTAAFEPAFVKAALESGPPSSAAIPTPAAEASKTTDSAAASPEQPDPSAAEPHSTPPISTIDPLAQIAATLTQLAVGSAARATLLTYGERVLAAAGDLPAETAQGIARVIAQAWKGGEEAGNTIVRYVPVPGLGDFLLYSATSLQGTWLSMLFPSETPLRAIRKQARALLEALEKSDGDEAESGQPQPPAEAETGAPESSEPEAARTLHSRPTDIRPPHGLREAIAASVSTEPAPPAEPPVLYSVLLAPREGMFDPAQFPLVPLWLTEACLEIGVHIEAVDPQPTFLSFQIGLRPTDTPNQVIRRVMDASEHVAKTTIWADGYYIASSNRALTQQEITQFLRLQKAS